MSLGPPINRQPLPAPLIEEWHPVPGKPHLLQNQRGQLRTNLPDPTTGKPPVPAWLLSLRPPILPRDRRWE